MGACLHTSRSETPHNLVSHFPVSDPFQSKNREWDYMGFSLQALKGKDEEEDEEGNGDNVGKWVDGEKRSSGGMR